MKRCTKRTVYPSEDGQINTSGTLNDTIPLRQESQRCIALLLFEPIEREDRQGEKDLENKVKTMVQTIDAEREGYYIHWRPRKPLA